MRLLDLCEDISGKGTYAGVRFHEDTKNAIVEFMKEHKIPNMLPHHKLHTTLLYSRKYLPKYAPLGTLSEPLIGTPTNFDVWKSSSEPYSNCLVMQYDCPQLIDRHRHLMDTHKATFDFDQYHPHITFSYSIGDMDIKPIMELIENIGKIMIVEEYMEDLDLDWGKKSVG